MNLPWVLALAWAGRLVVPWLLGALVQTIAAKRERTRRLLIAQGAMEERAQFAAEVHDVAGHGFALIAMQAGVALLDFDSKPAQNRRCLEAIQTTSGKSLSELRGMLDTFHDEFRPVPAAELVPPPEAETGERVGLCGLVDLITQVWAGGLPVRLDLHNLGRELDAETDSVFYRVVQESLTKVLRHAGPTTAEVTVEQDEETVVVRVSDHGRGGPVEPKGCRMIRVALADDHELVRTGLRALIDREDDMETVRRSSATAAWPDHGRAARRPRGRRGRRPATSTRSVIGKKLRKDGDLPSGVTQWWPIELLIEGLRPQG